MKITGILHVLTAARDRNGNCYHAAVYTDTATGAVVRFNNIGGPSNLDSLPRLLGHDLSTTYQVREVLPIREWQRLTRGWPYIANHSDNTAVEAVRAAILAAGA